MKAADPEQRFLELLKKHSWNEAVQLLKDEQKAKDAAEVERAREGKK